MEQITQTDEAARRPHPGPDLRVRQPARNRRPQHAGAAAPGGQRQAAAGPEGRRRGPEGKDLQEHVATRRRNAQGRPRVQGPGEASPKSKARRRKSCRPRASWPKPARSRWRARATSMSERQAGRALGVARSGRPGRSAASAARSTTVDLLREALQESEARGYQAGLAKAQAESQGSLDALAAKLKDLESILQLLAHPLAQLDAEVEKELLQLALTVGKQLARRELRVDPAQVIGIIRESLSQLPASARDVRVHLHPEDAATVRERLAATFQRARLDLDRRSDTDPRWLHCQNRYFSDRRATRKPGQRRDRQCSWRRAGARTPRSRCHRARTSDQG